MTLADIPARLVEAAAGLMSVAKYAAMAVDDRLGPPLIGQASFVVPPATTLTPSVNIARSGYITALSWWAADVTDPTAVVLCWLRQLDSSAYQYLRTEGQGVAPILPGSPAAGASSGSLPVGLPQTRWGFRRPIPVELGQSLNLQIVNDSATNEARFTLQWEQYAPRIG